MRPTFLHSFTQLVFIGLPNWHPFFDPTNNIQLVTWPPPHNKIYSRFWYAYSLFLRKFHFVNPYLTVTFANRAEPGSLRKRWNLHLSLSAKRILFYFQPKSDCLRTRLGAVHDERAECTCSCHGLCSKMWNPPRIEEETLFQHIKIISDSGINLIVWRGWHFFLDTTFLYYFTKLAFMIWPN